MFLTILWSPCGSTEKNFFHEFRKKFTTSWTFLTFLFFLKLKACLFVKIHPIIFKYVSFSCNKRCKVYSTRVNGKMTISACVRLLYTRSYCDVIPRAPEADDMLVLNRRRSRDWSRKCGRVPITWHSTLTPVLLFPFPFFFSEKKMLFLDILKS